MAVDAIGKDLERWLNENETEKQNLLKKINSLYKSKTASKEIKNLKEKLNKRKKYEPTIREQIKK